MVPNPWLIAGSGLELNWNCYNWFYPFKKLNPTEPTVFWPHPQFCKLSTLALINYLSSNRITIWYTCTSCSFARSVTSCSPICNLINICWVTANKPPILRVISKKLSQYWLDRKLETTGETTCRIASFTFISYCDMIRTQILNSSHRTGFAKLRLYWMQKTAK